MIDCLTVSRKIESPEKIFSYDSFLFRLKQVPKILAEEIDPTPRERRYGSWTPRWMEASKYRFILAFSMTDVKQDLNRRHRNAETVRLLSGCDEAEYESMLPEIADVDTDTPLGILYVFNDLFNYQPELLGRLCEDPQSIFGNQLPLLWEFLSGITAYRGSTDSTLFGPEINDEVDPVLKTARERLLAATGLDEPTVENVIKSVLLGVEKAVIQEIDENEFFAKAAALAALEALTFRCLRGE